MAVDCRECTSMIRGFLDDTLDNAELSGFLEHLESCEECREELSDSYLVYKGLEKLETGGAFDLLRDLQAELDNARRRLTSRRRFQQFAVGAEILTVFVFAITITLVLFY